MVLYHSLYEDGSALLAPLGERFDYRFTLLNPIFSSKYVTINTLKIWVVIYIPLLTDWTQWKQWSSAEKRRGIHTQPHTRVSIMAVCLQLNWAFFVNTITDRNAANLDKLP